MLVRVGNSKDVIAGQMRAFDVAGTRVNGPAQRPVPSRLVRVEGEDLLAEA